MQPLPYRTDPDDLHRFVAARARGRTAAQVRTLGYSAKNFEGTAAAVEALGLAADRNGDLSALGRRYALAQEDERAGVIRSVLRGYLPYALLIEAVLVEGGPDPTPVQWIETWWATHGYGSSESNRAEAAAVFARLAEAAGLGTYIQGRKGRTSRLQWEQDAAAKLGRTAEQEPVPRTTAPSETAAPARVSPPAGAPPATEPPQPAGGADEIDVLFWELAPGRTVSLHLPRRLSESERTRLRRLFELLLGG